VVSRKRTRRPRDAVVDISGRVAAEVALEHSHRELKEAGERLDIIIQSAMDAIITVDDRQNIVMFNAAAEKIFGCPVAEAISAPLDRFIPERFRAAHRGHIRHFGETGTTTRKMGSRLALLGLRENGEEFPIDASISQVTVEGRKLYTVILRDIAQRMRAEAEIRRERDTAQRYLDVVNVMLLALDAGGNVRLINHKGCEVLGYSEKEIIGQSWFDRFLPEQSREETRKVFGQIMAGETRLTESYENPVLSRSGEERMIAWHNRTLTDERDRIVGVLSSGSDITEREASEFALQQSYREFRELSTAMHEVREAERLRIARELHDELAQWLTAIKMDVSWLSSRLPREEAQLLARVGKMKGVVDTAVAAVRRIAADLRPVMLDDLGLVPAIEGLLHDLSQRTGIVISLDGAAAELDFREPLPTALYRIAQEALTNVARHAGATEVSVTMHVGDGRLVLAVRDNGRGFDPNAVRARSYGILGIRERAHTLGGTARFERIAEGGMLVEIVIPVARYQGRETTDDKSTAG